MNRTCVLLLAVGLFFTSASAAERLPNVVVFLVDDLGWSDLGCYDSPLHETPHIDRFADESQRSGRIQVDNLHRRPGDAGAFADLRWIPFRHVPTST